MDPEARPAISRAPLYVTLAFFAVSIGLVLYALQGSAAPSVVIDRPGTPDQPRAVTVILRDYVFNPTPIYLIRGETVRFTIINGGLVAHEFVLGDDGVQAAWASADAAATPPNDFSTAPPASIPAGVGGLRVLLDSGQEQTVDYLVPDDGDLFLICHLPGHAERGMVGRIEFRTVGQTAAPSSVP